MCESLTLCGTPSLAEGLGGARATAALSFGSRSWRMSESNRGLPIDFQLERLKGIVTWKRLINHPGPPNFYGRCVLPRREGPHCSQSSRRHLVPSPLHSVVPVSSQAHLASTPRPTMYLGIHDVLWRRSRGRGPNSSIGRC